MTLDRVRHGTVRTKHRDRLPSGDIAQAIFRCDLAHANRQCLLSHVNGTVDSTLLEAGPEYQGARHKHYAAAVSQHWAPSVRRMTAPDNS